MEKIPTEKSIAFQRLVCNNPECQHLLKEIFFFDGWEKRTNGNNGSSLIKNNGSSYYLCPKCRAKNYIIQQGEKIILEKIVRCEFS